MVPAVTMEQAEAIAERLRREIEALAGAGVRSVAEIAVTSSFGIAVLTPDITEPAKLIERADEALYEAKRSGRNRVVTWRPPETEVGPTTQ
jgi:diguanylate cyclase (GGDEF)-like protein